MQNIFIDILPPWVETGLQPAFYDLESGTVLQQTARMYAKVRELTEAFNTLDSDVTETVNNYIEQFTELHDYVEDYFDNLDVQEEINNKLDAMVEDGTLGDIIEGYLIPYEEELDRKVEGIEEDIDKLQNNSWGLVGISRDSSTGTVNHILYSPDGEKFYECGTMPNGVGSDSNALTEIEGKFYYFGNGVYTFTEDFSTWETVRTVNHNYNGEMSRRLWSNSAYYDEQNEIVYIYGAYQYNDDSATTPYGGSTYYFKICYQTATVNEDGTLNIDSTEHELIYDDTDSFIDPYVAKDPNLGYLIAYKSELTAKVTIKKMSSLTSADGTSVTNPIQGIEAPQLVTTPFGTLCYVDGYALQNRNDTDIQNLETVSGYFPVSYKGTMYSVNQLGLCPIYAPITLRHLGVMPCSKKAFYRMQQLGITTQIPTSSSRYDYMNGLMTISLSASSTPKIVNFPYALYSIVGNKTVTVKTAFKDVPLRIYVRKDVVITWSNDSTIQSGCKNKTYTAPHDEILTLYPDGRDSQGGMWVPIDRT